MGAALTWPDLYERAVRVFGGQTPGRELEAQVVEAYELRPVSVAAAVDDVAGGFAAGRIRAPWPFLARMVEEKAHVNVSPSGNAEREKRIEQAEQYMRAAGLYLASEAEVLDDLFGDAGRLRAWQDDAELVKRMLELWRSLQSAAERVEAEALERAEHWKQTRARLQASNRMVEPNPDADIVW
jgi:hypothetical protein